MQIVYCLFLMYVGGWMLPPLKEITAFYFLEVVGMELILKGFVEYIYIERERERERWR